MKKHIAKYDDSNTETVEITIVVNVRPGCRWAAVDHTGHVYQYRDRPVRKYHDGTWDFSARYINKHKGDPPDNGAERAYVLNWRDTLKEVE